MLAVWKGKQASEPSVLPTSVANAASAEAAKAELAGSYVDWRQQEIRTGFRSFYLAPWRAYMDTWDVTNYLDGLGIVFNVNSKEAAATARVLAEAGIRTARVEIGWDNLDYEDDSQLKAHNRANLAAILTALKEAGIRPLILLNMHSGMPNPSKQWKVTAVRDAEAGAREIFVDNTDGIIPHYTGLMGQTGYAMFPVITEADPATGRLVLSAPLPKAIAAGELTLISLKYRPFSGTVFADGTPNPAARETVDGWLKYVRTVTEFAKQVLGTEGSGDAGFDLEVFNEYSFGYHFTDINHYYEPDLEFAEPLSYTADDGRTQTGVEVILPLTVDYVNDPANGLPGVKVISGFSNQRPTDYGAGMWEGQAGFSRHYYTGYDPVKSVISPETLEKKNQTTLNALGEIDGRANPAEWSESEEGSFHVPEHIAAFPERWFYAYQTEFVVRDLQPFPGLWLNHHRYSNRNGHAAEVWMTETNTDRRHVAKELAQLAGTDTEDPAVAELMHWFGTKTTLRNYLFPLHKGIRTMVLYAAKASDNDFAVIPEAFFRKLKEQDYQLTDEVRQLVGPQLRAVANVTRLLQQGVPLDTTRPLSVENIVEYDPQLVFKGNGTEGLPDRYHRDDLAILPYQLDDRSFAIGYYVVTRNVFQAWDESKGVLDPDRYKMPDQTFDITLSNVNGEVASVKAYDPIEDRMIPATIVDAGANTITVQVQAVDYPRFLLLKELDPGPVIEKPELIIGEDGQVFFRFVTNVDGKAVITWGQYPVRSGGYFIEEVFEDKSMQNRLLTRKVNQIHYTDRFPDPPGAYRWTGTIVPKYSEAYTFILQTNDCNSEVWINGAKLIACSPFLKLEGSIHLEAGKPYELIVTNPAPQPTPHSMVLFWASKSQPREPVAPYAAGEKEKELLVEGRIEVKLPLEGFEPGDGVKLEFTDSRGLTLSYPRWNYDVAGVWWERD